MLCFKYGKEFILCRYASMRDSQLIYSIPFTFIYIDSFSINITNTVILFYILFGIHAELGRFSIRSLGVSLFSISPIFDYTKAKSYIHNIEQ